MSNTTTTKQSTGTSAIEALQTAANTTSQSVSIAMDLDLGSSLCFWNNM